MKCGFAIEIIIFASFPTFSCSNRPFGGIWAIPAGKDYLGMEWQLVRNSYWGFCGCWIKVEVLYFIFCFLQFWADNKLRLNKLNFNQ